MRVELDRITAAYGDAVALRDISLTVPAGKAVALLGPNGAGKTTLLSTVSGQLRPVSGRVLFDGVDVTAQSVERRTEQGLCYVTEGRSVFPGMTVRDNLRLFAQAGDEPDGLDRAITAFPKLGKRINQLAGTMSGGEQQMLALARVYARQPAVVLLDEVSMGLAPIIVDEIFESLAQLSAQGMSLLIVEQYVSKALALADYVYLLTRGRIVLVGEPSELEGSDLFTHYLGAEAGQLDTGTPVPDGATAHI
jgi:branched-chain amino acid transport system ATP-binding protein